MECCDPLTLQRLLDNDLDEAQSEIAIHHLQACASCQAEVNRSVELHSFVQEKLGVEDEGEEEATAASLSAIARALAGGVPRKRPQRWRRWLATAAVIVVAFLLPLPFASTLDAWPTRILRQAADRERIWMYQPNKTLYWQVDTISRGIRGVADGHWRTMFWRKNGAKSFAETCRQFNPEGKTEFAYWHQNDGSIINYRAKTGTIEIAPSIDAGRQALPTLPPDVRAQLQSYLDRVQMLRSLDFHRRRDADRFAPGSTWPGGGQATFRDGLVDLWGHVHHITVVNDHPKGDPTIVRVVQDYDVEASSLRLLRLRSTVTYANGTVGVHDSRWGVFREISAGEFDAQKPADLLNSGVLVVRLTPEKIAQRRFAELRKVSN